MKNLFLLDGCNWVKFVYANLTELDSEFKKRKITIGANCLIGNGCQLNNNIQIGANCTFGENCTIDYRAIVLSNANVGKFSVLGAESLVGKRAKIGAYCIVKVGATIAPLFIVEEFETYKNSEEVPYRHTDFQTLLKNVSKLY